MHNAPLYSTFENYWTAHVNANYVTSEKMTYFLTPSFSSLKWGQLSFTYL